MDWNKIPYWAESGTGVEAYTASWIEIQKAKRRQVIKEVEAYTASWIEMEQWRCTMVHGLVEAYTASWIEI